MNIKITDLVENLDGSADCKLHFDNVGLRILVQEGFTSIIM
jgi:hypothetical protein